MPKPAISSGAKKPGGTSPAYAKLKNKTRSAEFQAALRARSAQVAASKPTGRWFPPEGQDHILKLIDADIETTVKNKKGEVLSGTTRYSFTWVVDDGSSAYNGKPFTIEHMLFPPGPNDQREDSIEASRIRNILETALDGAECADESLWPEQIVSIIESGANFRGTIKSWKNKKGYTSTYAIVKDMIAGAKVATAAFAAPDDDDDDEVDGAGNDAGSGNGQPAGSGFTLNFDESKIKSQASQAKITEMAQKVSVNPEDFETWHETLSEVCEFVGLTGEYASLKAAFAAVEPLVNEFDPDE